MRTRRSHRNQEILWRALGGPEPAKPAPGPLPRQRCKTARGRYNQDLEEAHRENVARAIATERARISEKGPNE